MSVTPSVVTPGSLVTVRITGFSLGTVGQGPNGTYDAWLQPIGNLDFDPTCLRLVRSEVQLNSISGSAFVDRLYFTDLRSYSNNPADYVAYTFLSLRPCTTVVQPYQEAASGTQEKYNADFSASTSRSTVTGDGSSALIITIQPDRSTVSAGDTIHYAVTFSAPNAPATVVDLNNGGDLEVLVGAADGKLYAWHQDGQPVAGWPITLNPSFRILATPAVGNIDGDGFLDVVVPLADGKLYAVDAGACSKRAGRSALAMYPTSTTAR